PPPTDIFTLSLHDALPISYGLRNPWRFSFDRQNGDLYIGDVGQDQYEEVDIAPVQLARGPGANYGWNIMEGKHCYPSDPCTTTRSEEHTSELQSLAYLVCR